MPYADGAARARIRDQARRRRLRIPGAVGRVGVAQHHPSKTKGIGAWTDAEIKRAITTGVSRDGNKLKPPMGFHYYST